MAHDLDCLSCAFYKALPQVTSQGLCRRLPPTPLFMGFQENPINPGRPQPIIQTHWPLVGKGALCGEHPFMAGMRKIPVLGAATELRNMPGVMGQGNGATPPDGAEAAELVDGSDAEVLKPVPDPYQKVG